MELADLRIFLAIAEQRGISAAARALRLPKSSVSRGLMRLEGAVGAALVDRSSQHLRLTDAGELMRSRASRVLDEADDLRTALDGLAERPRGRLRINAPYTFSVALIAPMLASFANAYPDVRVVLDIDNKLVNLHAGEVDLAVRIGPLADSGLIAQRLTRIALWSCAGPGYLSIHGSPQHPGEFARHRLVSRGEAPTTWRFERDDGERALVEVAGQLVVPEPAAMLAAAVAGSGIARLPDFLARDAIAAGRLVRLLPEWRAERVDVHVLYTSRRALPGKARVFIAALIDHLATR